MTQEVVHIFDKGNIPSTKQLGEICTLFINNLPIFDEQSTIENKDTLALHRSPEIIREQLKTKTILAIANQRQEIAGILEWDPRDKDTVMLAYITWLLVDRSMRGQGFSSILHFAYEHECIPQLRHEVTKSIFQGLGVHVKNPAINIYRKWGYSEEGAPQWNDGRRLFMIKNTDTTLS